MKKFLLGLSIVIASLGAASAAHAQVQIKGQNGLCLNAEGGSSADGTKLVVWPCDEKAPNDKWTWNDNGGSAPIKGIGGKCVDVEGGGNADGAALILYTCTGGDNQKWTWAGEGTIRSMGKCMNIKGGNAKAGSQVILWKCTGKSAPNEIWQVLG